MVVALAAAAVGGWLASGGAPPPPDDPGPAPTPSPDAVDEDPEDDPAVPDEVAEDGVSGPPGPWRLLPHAPLVRRTGHSMTWTGEELIVWGGSRPRRSGPPHRGTHLGSGAAYDPVTDRWRRIAPAPIAPRDGHVAVWSGRELLVWGGRAGAGGPHGAAYEPATGTWRQMAAGPLDEHAAHAHGAWTGRGLLVWAHAADRLQVAVYDPDEDVWRGGTGLDLPADSAVEGAWAGDRLAVLATRPGGAASLQHYDPRGDRWDHVAGQVFPQPEGFAAADTTVVLWGRHTGERFGRPWAAAVDVRSGAVRDIPAPSVHLARDHLAVATGRRLLVWDGLQGSVLDLARDRWVTLPDAPLAPRRDAAGAWTGQELVVWGGGGERYHADGARVRPLVPDRRGGGYPLR